jgi:hypothetical protein
MIRCQFPKPILPKISKIFMKGSENNFIELNGVSMATFVPA